MLLMPDVVYSDDALTMPCLALHLLLNQGQLLDLSMAFCTDTADALH